MWKGAIGVVQSGFICACSHGDASSKVPIIIPLPNLDLIITRSKLEPCQDTASQTRPCYAYAVETLNLSSDTPGRRLNWARKGVLALALLGAICRANATTYTLSKPDET